LIKICNRLYIGNHSDARNLKFLNTIGIERIVVCPPDIPNYFPDQKEYLRLDLQPDTEITQELVRKFLTFIGFEFYDNDTLIHIEKTTLIHCHSCIERAPSLILVIGCEMGFPFKDMLNFVKSKVPNYSPNTHMLESIRRLYEK